MKKSILNLEGAVALSKSEKKNITGGKGPYKVKCNSGVWVEEVPNLNAATTAWACSNQGGYADSYIFTGTLEQVPSIQP